MARSASCWTLPSHLTMFTGLWPEEHGAGVDRAYLGASPTLAEHLRENGYATAGFAANVRMCNCAYGVGRGFDTYVDYPWNNEISLKAAMSNSASVLRSWRSPGVCCCLLPAIIRSASGGPCREIATDGRQWLDEVRRRNEKAAAASPRPFFLFLNLFDVHSPYLPTQGRIAHSGRSRLLPNNRRWLDAAGIRCWRAKPLLRQTSPRVGRTLKR